MPLQAEGGAGQADRHLSERDFLALSSEQLNT
jgi:hypothetical protein